MQVTAKLSYLRIAPRKVRLVADLIRGKSARKAQAILEFTTKRASLPLAKLLKQALANAKNNFQLDPDNFYVSKITVDEGPKQKRWMPRARGQAYEIQKKSSHVLIVLDEIKKTVKKAKTGQEIIKKAELEEIKEETIKPEKATGEGKFRQVKPKAGFEAKKPKTEQGLRRVFRRKAI